MPAFTSYHHGTTASMPHAGNPNPPKRGKTSGWSAGAARRNLHFLWSVDERELHGVGLAITLTVKDCPPTADEWQSLVKRWIDRQRKAGMIRLHWVTEWQRRGVPHLHVTVWYDPDSLGELDWGKLAPVARCITNQSAPTEPEEWEQYAKAATKPLSDWVELAAPYTCSAKGQHCRPLTQYAGWAEYVAKHASRGHAHYQRQRESIPEGWKSTGRVWGKRGHWPIVEPVTHEVDRETFWRFRRLVKRRRLAEAREYLPLNGKQYGRLRRLLKCGHEGTSATRGMSEWIPQQAQESLLTAAVICRPAHR